MFTGIIQAVGQLEKRTSQGGDERLRFGVGKLDMADVALGDSIACNGVCLTVVAFDEQSFEVDVSKETLTLTSLKQLSVGSKVNLEKALTLSDRLGGHLVSGHVDGLAKVIAFKDLGRAIHYTLEAPDQLARYIVKKGSVCIDGVSLTVNEVDGNRFELTIVPHTLQETIMGEYRQGSEVNLEVDLIARYLERLLSSK